jgi:hypothetical protein
MTVKLDDDLYAVARSLAKAEDCSIGEAINRLIRRGISPQRQAVPASDTGGWPVVHGDRLLTSEDIYGIDLETG